jgi:hypothetical protein
MTAVVACLLMVVGAGVTIVVTRAFDNGFHLC